LFHTRRKKRERHQCPGGKDQIKGKEIKKDRDDGLTVLETSCFFWENDLSTGLLVFG
jgi:hypothetical protein